MLAKPFARLMDRSGIHYGWVMVALTFLTQLSTASAMGIAGVLVNPLAKEFGWSIEAINAPMGFRLVVSAAWHHSRRHSSSAMGSVPS